MSYIMHALVGFLTDLISRYGYFSIFVLMAAESALIPIPSEVTMPFAGFLAGRGVVSFWAVTLIGAIGNTVGSLLAYYLGYYKGEEWTLNIIRRWGKWLLLKESEFERSKKWFHTHGQWITFASRLLPIVRTFISLPAGIAKMNVPLFTLLTFVGSFIWSGLLAFVGLKLGQNWMAIEPFFRKFQIVIIAGFGIMAYIYIRHHLKHKE
ncbi:MAG: DedA [Candidatus Woesebacteria bacterium GW2011_GWA1_39_8]|uniref:DedA n=1 Tax=Candidatus Woesebacteria bacterium GW2011_GWA1_39_8 TaxID=1618552 RepID=A0A0G0PWW2_9BACT|nr:MAG: DedA [Candidatus Woesebacteria bacterium GW2011_GWA1_39_8]